VTGGSNVAANAVDGSTTTRWSTGANQVSGQWFQVDMTAQRTFVGLRMDTTTTATDFPRSFQVNVSNDGTNWGSPVATGTGNSAVTTLTFASQNARFVRVTLAGAASANWSIYEFNVYDTTLSRTGWVASASSTSGTNVAANALDGSTSTRWSSSGAQTGQWFQVDMTSPQTFSQLTLDAGSSTSNNFPRGYSVVVSNDGTNWSAAVATGTGTTRFIVINFATQLARFVRVNQTATNSTTWSIEELNVNGQPTIQTAETRTGWTATATSSASGTTPANALDGSTTTRWTSNTAQTSGMFFQVDMLTLRIFNQVTLDAGTSTNNFPRSFQLQVSSDATSWTTVTTGTGTTALVTINFPAVTARYLKVNLTAANSNPWSIQEMNITGAALSRTAWGASASATGGTDVAANAIDGNAATRWDTGVHQANGQTFTLDMGTSQVFNQLTLDAGTSTGNFPRGYSTQVSSDGINWGTAVATGTGSTQLVTISFLTQTARFIRITQTGTSTTNDWSIHEINVFRITQPCDGATCTALDQCHVAGTCDPNAGTCSNPDASDGTNCNDNNACTTGETCQAGVCGGGTAVTCTADQCHTAGTCVPVTGCPAPMNKPDGTNCNDSNACTTGEQCHSGVCNGGTAVTCTADQCHTAGTCVPETGCPAPAAKTDGTTCNDGNACTQTDSCQAGVCTGTNQKTCAASDQCHVAGTCDPNAGTCSNPNASDGTNCNDNNACTTGETCQAGVCGGGTAVTCTADQCHTAGTCVPATGCPAPAPKANGTACDDGNLCTIADACQAGTCTGAPSPACNVPPGLTAGQIDAARQAGLLPGGFLTPTFYDPLGNAPDNTATVALGINNSGAVAGFTRYYLAEYPVGEIGYPYMADGNGERQLTSPWGQSPPATAYAVDVNDSGYVLGEGGPFTYATGNDFLRPVVYHPGGTSYELPWVSTKPGFQVFSINNLPGSAGLPTIVGSASFYGGTDRTSGTLAVWHMDGNANDAIGPSGFTPPGGATWIAGHTTAPGHTHVAGDRAVNLDGSACLSTTEMVNVGESGPYFVAAGMTVLAWVMPDPSTCSRSRRAAIASRGSDFSIWLDCDAAGAAHLQAYSHTSTGDHWTSDAGTVPFGKWSHVAVTWDKARARSFVNGQLVGDEPLDGRIGATSSAVSVGCWPTDPTLNFVGAIDEVSMFQNGMGADEIALYTHDITNYNRTPPTSSQWARIQDGFYNILVTPAGPLYANSGQALHVNDAGVVVGYQNLTVGGSTAVMFDPASGWKNLNDLIPPDSNWDLRIARSIDPSSRYVVGDGAYYGRVAPFRLDLWTSEVTDLGNFADYPYSDSTLNSQMTASARDINAQGHVAGSVRFPSWPTARPFIYTDGTGLVDLNDFIDPAAGWTLHEAFAINDHDEIVGWAEHGDPYGDASQQVFRGYKLGLVPLPSAGDVFCQGKPDGTTCDDRNPCTQTDTCQGNACVGTNPVTCVAQGQCRLVGTCDPGTGVCSTPAKAAGTACDDGNACTQGESCQAGSCQAVSPYPVIVNLPVDDVGSAGTLGGTYATASDVNASGQIVGSATNASGETHAFLRTGSGPMVNVVPNQVSEAASVNDAGTLAGTWVASGVSRAFREYTSGAGFQDLGLGPGGDGLPAVDDPQYRGAYAYTINNNSQVAGAFTSGGLIRGFRFTDQGEDGLMEEIPTLQNGMTRALGLSASGTVVGTSWVAGSPTTGIRRFGHAVMFNDSVVSTVDLNTYVDPTQWTLITANHIAGNYVVGAGDHGGAVHAYRLNLSTNVIDDLGGGWEGETYGLGTNNEGDVVGWGYLDAAMTRQAAFIYTDQIGFKNLGDVIDPTLGWDVRVASAINDKGDVVGWGYRNSQVTAFHMNLAPQQIACGAVNSCGGGGGAGDGVCLWTDGVVDVGGGQYVAVFGFQNPGTASVHPTTNQVLVDGVVVTNPQPAPPAYLPSGSHPGAFLPKVAAGHTVAWQVDGKTVSVTAPSASGAEVPGTRVLQEVPIGTSGEGVIVDGTLVTLKADLAPWKTPPTTEPDAPKEPTPGAAFNGVLTGQLSVSPSGAATYAVPIKIPPGIAGMAPNLNLVYSSQGGNGIAGQGWEFTGLSAIHRCPKTKVQDGVGHQVSLNDSDPDEAVCLDGKRLFEQGNQSGTYKLEQDDHSKITKVYDNSSDPTLSTAGFKIVTKTGETRYYGTSERSRVRLPISTGPVAAWALERVMDAFGNFYDISYDPGFAADGLLVMAIDYTGHVPTSGALPVPNAGTPTFEHVSFTYESRPDVQRTRFGSQTLPKTSRLKAISSSAGKYTLSYAHDYDPTQPFKSVNDPSTDNDPMQPSRLLQIDYCVKDGTECMAPLRFTWDGGGYSWQEAPDFALQAPIDNYGEGNNYTRGTQFIDIDGDGRLDFVEAETEVHYVTGVGGTGSLEVNSRAWRNTGAGWEEKTDSDPQKSWALPAGVWLSGPGTDNVVQRSGVLAQTLFADVDGDGLPDLIARRNVCTYLVVPTNPPSTNPSFVCHPDGVDDPNPPNTLWVWLNRFKQGRGWELHPEYDLSTASLNGGKTVDFHAADQLLDMNGDGRADFVRMGPGDFDIQVRYSSDAGWVVPAEGFSLLPLAKMDPTIKSGTLPFDHTAYQMMRFQDINRDGLPDLITTWGSFCNGERTVGINTGANTSNGTVWNVVLGSPCPTDQPQDKQLVGDIDGDGFRDVITYYKHYPDYLPNAVAGTCDSLNTAACDCPATCFPNDTTCQQNHGGSCACGCPTDTSVSSLPTVTFATGSGWSTSGNAGWLSGLFRYTPPEIASSTPNINDFILGMADLNADGLADVVLNHFPNDPPDPTANGGQLLINWGGQFIDIEGRSKWETSADPVTTRRVPVVPTADKDFASPGAAFVDLDGDGVTDLVRSTLASGTLVSNAWLNKYRPPTIYVFPNGLAEPSVVGYQVITTAAAQDPTYGIYSDPEPAPGAGTTFFMAPLRVVGQVSQDSGLGAGNSFYTTYHYESLRGSAYGRGPQGFAKVTAVDERQLTPADPYAHRVTETTYYQSFPYTGLPQSVTQSIGHPDPVSPPMTSIVLSTTVNQYCDTADAAGIASCPQIKSYPPGTSVFVYPKLTSDSTNLFEGDVMLSQRVGFMGMQTEYRYDTEGNPITTTVTSTLGDDACNRVNGCPTSQKTVENRYEATGQTVDLATLQQFGKPTSTVVTSQSLIPLGAPIVHTTGFTYLSGPIIFPPHDSSSNPVELRMKVIEPGQGDPIEEHSVYEYDGFGNLVGTAECTSDVQNCDPTTSNPPPSMRISSVVYTSESFAFPSGGRVTALSYTNGRFPVMKTNALGDKSYFAYDPVFGGLLQETDANGVNTCHLYDDFGRLTTSIDRCGTGQEQITTVVPTVAKPSDPAGAKVVITTHDPTGVGSWAYQDGFGRTIVARGRSFDGGFTEATKSYDEWGRVQQESSPWIIGSGEGPHLTTTIYDAMGRVTSVTKDLGATDGLGTVKTSIQTISYHGTRIHTEQNVDGVDDAHLHTQFRDETKGVLGKVVAVSDANGETVSYGYDADSNLTDVTSAQGNVHIGYDTRGRKNSTSDPDVGQWFYTYDAFGDLLTQMDARRQVTSMTYDQLGRMKARTDLYGTPSAKTAQWVYDKAPGAGKGRLAAYVSPPDDKLLGPCAVPYAEMATDGNRTVRSFTYTAFGQVEDDTQCTDGDSFTTSYDYDPSARLQHVTYPAVDGQSLSLLYHYTQLNFLYFITDTADNTLVWEGTARDARGQVFREQTGNGVETTTNRSAATGWELGSTSVSHADSDNLIQNWAYSFDEVGNLRGRLRSDSVSGPATTEIFTYDSLNRLRTTSKQVGNAPSSLESYDIDNYGNLTAKAGKSYTYGNCGAGPHAVCSVEGSDPYQYDSNGNLSLGGGRSLTYDGGNRPVHIENGSAEVDFVYSAERNRVVQIAGPLDGTNTTRTVYVGLGATGKSMYERATHGGTVEHTHFLYAGDAHGGGAFAVKVIREQSSASPTTSTSYYHFDHLGSVTTISDESGHVLTPDWSGPAATVMSYDAWGSRRDPLGQPADPTSFSLQPGHREYTGHETIPDVGLVNMNGRVYDPVLGRFLAPDPNVQFVADLQSYNRYSYVHNNPLSYTDPTGYFSFGVAGPFGYAWAGLLGVTVSAACAASYGYGCVVGGVMLVAYTSTTMAMSGASFGQIVEANVVSIAAGVVGGEVGGEVAAGLGGGLAAQMAGGVVSGMMTAVLSSAALNENLGGTDLLQAALEGAIGAGIAMGMADPISQPSEASAAQSRVAIVRGSGAMTTEALERFIAAGGFQLEDPSEALATDVRQCFIAGCSSEYDISGTGSLKGRIRDVPIIISGGTPEERANVLGAMNQVFLGSSGGARMLNRLELNTEPDGWFGTTPKPFFVLIGSGGSGSAERVNLMSLDFATMTKTINTDQGPLRPSLTRIVAHELGHAVMGYSDDGPGRMNTVNKVENPIMLQLSETYRRTTYP
jgi:RHS repeat-associated protein